MLKIFWVFEHISWFTGGLLHLLHANNCVPRPRDSAMPGRCCAHLCLHLCVSAAFSSQPKAPHLFCPFFYIFVNFLYLPLNLFLFVSTCLTVGMGGERRVRRSVSGLLPHGGLQIQTTPRKSVFAGRWGGGGTRLVWVAKSWWQWWWPSTCLMASFDTFTLTGKSKIPWATVTHHTHTSTHSLYSSSSSSSLSRVACT
jgi:hypothetical protein